LAIRSCFVDTLSRLQGALGVSQKRFCTTVPRFPRLGPREPRSPASSVLQSTTTSCVDYGVAYVFRFPAPTEPLLVRSLAVERTAGPGPARARYRWIYSAGHTQDLPVPGESIPYLCPALESRPVRQTSPYRPNNAAPILRTVKALTSRTCRDSSRSFGTRCLRFKWCVTAPACKARFRPVASLCREGVEPSGLHRKVSIRYIGFPPFPDLAWRYRKTPARVSMCLLRDEDFLDVGR
jgi:hypothetical protein